MPQACDAVTKRSVSNLSEEAHMPQACDAVTKR
jgi:hypothetical protein